MANKLKVKLQETPRSSTLGGLVQHIRNSLGSKPKINFDLDTQTLTVEGDFKSKTVYDQILTDEYQIEDERLSEVIEAWYTTTGTGLVYEITANKKRICKTQIITWQ